MGIKLVKFSIAILFALVILPSNMKAIAILIFGITTLSLLIRRKWSFDRNFFITNGLFYLVVAITYLYSDNTEYAIKKLQTMASLLVFPFIFAMISKQEMKSIFKNECKYLWIYIASVFLFTTVTFIWFFVTKYSWIEMMVHFQTVLMEKIGKFNIHPIYVSMHCSAAILCSFYLLKKVKSKFWIVVLLLMDSVLLSFLLLFAKKGPIIALLVVFTLYILFQYKKGYFKLYLLAAGMLVVLTIAIPKTRERFVELFSIENLDKGSVTSTNIRYTIYVTAKNLIAQNPITGYGIGDYNYVLKDKYKEDGHSILQEGAYNAHNQYLSMMLIGGIFLVIAFIFMFGMNMVYAIRFNNQLFILLIVFYSIVMFTENILEREDGVIFFAFFLNFFALKSLYVREEEA